jgi:hypothetical protein
MKGGFCSWSLEGRGLTTSKLLLTTEALAGLILGAGTGKLTFQV